VLLELNVPFSKFEIPKENSPSWFIRMNPRGAIPALQNPTDGTFVYGTTICNEYLCDLAREEVPEAEAEDGILMMMPTKAKDRAQLRVLCDHVDHLIVPKLNAVLTNADKEKEEKLISQLETTLGLMEHTLQEGEKGEDEEGETGKDYLMGKTFSVADAHLLPFFNRMMVLLPKFMSYSTPEDKFPLLLKWLEKCKERESVQKSIQKEEDMIAQYNKFIDNGYKW